MGRTRRTFTAEEKLKVVMAVIQEGRKTCRQKRKTLYCRYKKKSLLVRATSLNYLISFYKKVQVYFGQNNKI